MPLTNATGFPVVIWIHERSYCHGPDFFIDEDIIVVTVSFRTGIFGYLNTGDGFALGNMGAKDMLTAIKWVKSNIRHFKGDIDKITVIGSGEAAASVATFPLTSAARNLFSRIIVESGSALSPENYRNYNFEISNKLYWNLNGPFKKLNRTNLYQILANSTTNELLLASGALFDSTEVRDNQRLINSFGPTVELSGKGAFMNKFPSDIYKRPLPNKSVDVMFGYTSLEYLHKLRGFVDNRKLLKFMNYNFQYLVPFEGKIDEYGSKRYQEIRQRIMDFYFANGTIGERSLRRYAKYVSDQAIYPVIRQARSHSEKSGNNVYLYRFSYKGCLNIVRDLLLRNFKLTGATGGDEVCYQFTCKSANRLYRSEVSSERRFVKKIARLLANFAKHGDPTPEGSDEILGDLKWTPMVDLTNIKGLNLNRKIKMIELPEMRRVRFWDQLKREYFEDFD
ncbi:esterase E4-like [Bombyx mandarina]|uniref:Esterase E4-like n=1 Tax=Bombyx mandarina TaxID=7092 RepID=A0A6J2J7B2_BOMMA|nr:esterase E4-like [Bombyx mandarina]